MKGKQRQRQSHARAFTLKTQNPNFPFSAPVFFSGQEKVTRSLSIFQSPAATRRNFWASSDRSLGKFLLLLFHLWSFSSSSFFFWFLTFPSLLQFSFPAKNHRRSTPKLQANIYSSLGKDLLHIYINFSSFGWEIGEDRSVGGFLFISFCEDLRVYTSKLVNI